MYKSLAELAKSPKFNLFLEAGVKKCFHPDKACDSFKTLIILAIALRKDNDILEFQRLLRYVETNYSELSADWLWNINLFLDAAKNIGDSIECGLKKLEIQATSKEVTNDKYMKGRLPIVEYAISSYAESGEYEKIVRLAQEVVMKNHEDNSSEHIFGYILQEEALGILLHYFNTPLKSRLSHFYFNSLRGSIDIIELAFQALKLIEVPNTKTY